MRVSRGIMFAAHAGFLLGVVAVLLACSRGSEDSEVVGASLWGETVGDVDRVEAGRLAFGEAWVEAPSVLAADRDGLGPVMVAPSCASCHGTLGRSSVPAEPGDPVRGATVLLRSASGSDSLYGDQLQDRALPGFSAEGDLAVRWVEESGRFADGEVYSLRRPEVVVTNLAWGELPPVERTHSLRR
jgi:CxxC motif-containing protein (DUF1111 family)